MKLYTRAIFLVLAAATVPHVFAAECEDQIPNTSTSGSSAATTTTPASSGSSSTTQSSTDSASGIADLAVVTPVVDCANLANVDLTSIGGNGSIITSATEVVNNGITYCSVEGTLPPQIGFQVILPVSTWTQRYMQIGCGGLCGSISLSVGAADGSDTVTNGNFVLASTDMSGGSDGTFGEDPDRRVAFAYRAVHLTALVAKDLISNYYGQNEVYSYFNGCSDGGREAVMEALRYPEDFNGIIAGAPAMLFQFQNSLHHGWLAVSNTNTDGQAIVVSDRLSIIHDAVIAACDSLDGIEDGLLSDPRTCSFDIITLQCADDSTDTSTCLTTEEVEAVLKFYSGPTDTTTGEHLTVGEAQFGSELQWSGVFVPGSADETIFSETVALAALRYLIFDENPGANYTLSDLAFDTDTVDLLRPHHPLFDAVSPDLTSFKDAGGKLILWHGWADPHISPHTTIRLHEGLIKQLGEDEVADFERLYLLPGVGHCGGGEGMSAIDLVTPMLQWIETGSAPDAVLTSTAAATSDFGQPTTRALRQQASTSGSESTSSSRTRPVYPYPAVAKYTGEGDVNDAANYVAGDALYTEATADWAGDDFFDVYTPIE